ncbi:MAG: alanine racemase [Gemmatimonadaceae bacterium]
MSTRREFVARAAMAAVPFAMRGVWPALPQRTFDPWLEIDAAALARNAQTISRMAGGRPVIAVVKNNAYGHGLATIGPHLDGVAEIRMLAVVRPTEALELRRAGAKKPILLMGPATEEELLDLVPMEIVQAPFRAAAPQILQRVSVKLNRPVRVHLYIDTGMHRMGMPVADSLLWIDALVATRAVRIEGAFTELVEDADFDRDQASRLSAMHRTARSKGIDLGLLHAASSDAVQRHRPDTFLDAVRPGLALYGGYVSEEAKNEGGLTPTYRLKARVMRVDRLAAGEGVSYHRRWTTDKPVWTATLAVGHVDGYPSGAVNGCDVLVRGKLHPVIGTVSASHTIIALGETQSAEVGDEAILVGPDHPALHPNEVAKRAGYSEYNMFMHLSPLLRRVVVSQ